MDAARCHRNPQDPVRRVRLSPANPTRGALPWGDRARGAVAGPTRGARGGSYRLLVRLK
eukprot:SAG31_NODE_694_length_12769_cov_8.102447_1_plen_59_part_00